MDPPRATEPASIESASSEERPIEPGTNIGRYIALDPLGEGAMGRVVRAYDPKLAREVAIKQIKSFALDDAAEKRLSREAMAMARLSHPNVVGIYDVELEHHRLLIVMEYVGGTTLREWLRQPRGWREVLEYCRQAGRGLAAAHAAGLVHRDFKPGNVLIGKDGRARVTDFGLARIPGEPGSEDPAARAAAVLGPGDTGSDSHLTRTGAVVGTPAYMAPEQHQRREADARADQFAFCVTLWEGLIGERPFRDDGLEDKALGPPEPPRGRGIPRRVLEAMRRGLAPDPAARWPSMRHLLDELDRAMRGRRQLWLTAAGATVVGALGLWALLPAPSRCTGAELHLADVWGPVQREEVESALYATGVSYAADAWTLVAAELDEYHDGWVAMHTESCEATAIRGEQSTEVLDLRMACLHRARDELDAAVEVLESADATVVERAREVVTGLPHLSHCADVEALRAERPAPEDPELAEAVDSLRRRVAELSWMSRAGRYEEALQRIVPLRERANELGHDPLRAEVELLHGELLDHQARPAEAEAALRESMRLALEQGAHDVAVDAIVRLLEVVGDRQSRPAEAQWLATVGMGLATQWRMGDERVAALHRGRGLLLSAQGLLPQAEAEHRKALERLLRSHGEHHLDVLAARLSLASVLDERSEHEEAETIHREVLEQYLTKLGPRHPEVAEVHLRLGRSLALQGRYPEAEAEHRRALTLLEAALGADHPRVAEAANELGTCLYDQAKFDEAEQAYLRALRIHETATPAGRDPQMVGIINNLAQIEWRRGNLDLAETHARRALVVSLDLHGPEHPDVGRQRNNLALVLKARGRLDEAATELSRVLEIYEASMGPDHSRVGTALLNLGNVRLAQGRLDDAERHYRRALAVLERSLGPEHPKVAMLQTNLGSVVARHDPAEARERCERALAIDREVLGPTHPNVGMALACLGQVAQVEGKQEEAVALLEQALALEGDGKSTAAERPEMRLELARALWGTGQHARALSEAEAALATATRQGNEGMQETIRGWLDAPSVGSD
ncbi:MAG: serine/threonine protein kinase [Myxococcales bacterium]|nr:serine/threonine protein kinase [Myxococcales bacterium]MCB9718944.1 serine/threonine protein kinase [Myxococcales bacterium]